MNDKQILTKQTLAPLQQSKKKKPVKCHFKNITADDKEKFKHSHCLLLISVGQEAHEGERFAATIKLVNEHFNSCTISLYDSLQRSTMALSSKNDPESFHQTANQQGDLWLQRNAQFYQRLTIPTNVTRWDEWLLSTEYQGHEDILLDRLNSEPEYQRIFDVTIEKYLDRYCKNIDVDTKFDMDRAKRVCFKYILEECAVLCMWLKLNCQYEIYPNLHNDAMEATRQRFINPNYPNLLRPLTLRFTNAGQLRPQNFNHTNVAPPSLKLKIAA